MRPYHLLAASLAIALISGCSSDGTTTPPPPSNGGGDNHQGNDGSNSIEFATFARNLVESETKNENLPTPTENRTFTDKEDPSAFPPAFFR